MAQTEDGRIGKGKFLETDPLLHPAGTELFFVRPAHKNNLGSDNAPDIWLRKLATDGSWGRAINPGPPINSPAGDRPLSFSPDGNLIAVLREEGSASYLIVFRRNGRGWDEFARSQVPGFADNSRGLAFNVTSGELVFSRKVGPTGYDLSVSKLDGAGKWSPPTPLTVLNSSTDELRPAFAADGRSLYFFRSNEGWYRQDDRGLPPVRTRIPIRSRAFGLAITEPGRAGAGVVAIATDNGSTAELRLLRGAPEDYPPPGRVVLLSVDDGLELTSGRRLAVLPLTGLRRHTLFIRDAERPADGSQLDDLSQPVVPMGGLATAGRRPQPQPRSFATEGVERRIAAARAHLTELDAERNTILNDRAYPDPRPPERAGSKLDTLPPDATVRERYAADLEELNEMKRRFVQQQEARRSRRSGEEWTARSSGNTDEPYLPSIGDSYTPPVPPARQRALRQADSLDRVSRIRQGLDRTPDSFDRSWEYRLRRDLPERRRARVTEIDDEYARKLAELNDLRAELARLRGEPPAPAAPRNPAPDSSGLRPRLSAEFGAKGAAPRPADIEIPAPAASPYSNEKYTALPITFIENTAYVDGKGYEGLEVLVELVSGALQVVTIRVHTPAAMDRRSAQHLSEERAVTIRDYLVGEGIPVRRFRVQGFGNNLSDGGERVEVGL